MSMSEKITLEATKSIPLNIPKGFYSFWTITTQAAFKIGFELRDTKQTYVSQSRQSQNILPPLSQTYARLEGDNLSLLISIAESKQIDARMKTMDITDSNNNLLARSVTIVGEDSTDMDYNDIFFTITAWRNQG